MSIAFSCACGRNLRAGPHLAGKKTKCPGCGAVLTIPAADVADVASADSPPPPAPRPVPAAARVTAPAAAPAASSVTCTCGKRIATKPEWAGKTIKCPACENRIKVPASTAVAPAAAAAAKPVAKRPAPPPIEDDDPFGADEGLGADEGGGGYQGFSDDGASDSDDEDNLPPRKGKSPAPAKAKSGGGSKVLFLVIVLLLLIGAGGAAYFVFFYNPAPTHLAPPDPSSIVKPKPGAGDEKDPDDNETDTKTPDGKGPAKTSKGPDGTEPPDPKTTLPDTVIPPSDPTPPKKKSGLPELPNDLPKLAPPKIGLDLEEPKVEPKVDPKAAPDKQSALDLVPADAVSFAVVRTDAFFKSPSGSKIASIAGPMFAKADAETTANFGIGLRDFRSVVLVARAASADPRALTETSYAIIESAKPFDPDVIVKMMHGSKKEVDGRTLLSSANPREPSFLLLSPTQALLGSKKLVTEVASKSATKDGPLAAALKDAAASKALVFVAFQVSPDLADLREKGLSGVRDGIPGSEALADATSGQLTISEDKALSITLKLRYADADRANKAKKASDDLTKLGTKMLDGAKDFAKSMPEGDKLLALAESGLASVKPSIDGEELTIPLQIDATIADLAEIGMTLMPMMGPGPGGPRPGPPPPKQIEKE